MPRERERERERERGIRAWERKGEGLSESETLRLRWGRILVAAGGWAVCCSGVEEHIWGERGEEEGGGLGTTCNAPIWGFSSLFYFYF